MTQHEKLFESLPPTRLFFRCALPSMISMAMLSLYTVADGIFVGRYVGPNALAAVNLVMPLIMMSFALVDLVAVGSSVQISIRLGEKNERAANRIFSFCTGLIVALSCVIGLGGFFLAGPMVSLMGAEAEVTAMGAEYMQVYAVFAPVIMVFFAVDNYLRICGRVRYSMILNVVTALLNIVLDFLFLVVFRWGVAAAAAASCLSIALGTVLGFLPFVMGRLPLRFVRGTISARQLGNILANGSSEFFSSIAGSVMMVILNSVLLRLSGSMAVAAFSIVMYVDSIVGSLLFGMADSIQPAISYNYGARRRDRMLALEKGVLLTGAAVSLAALLWMQLGGQYVIPLFIQGDDPALLEMSLRAMRLFSLSYLLGWAGTCLSSFFTALNRPGRSLILAFSKTLVFPLACLAVLPAALGLDGVWLTAPAAGVLTAALAVWFLIAVLRQERAQDRQEGEGTPQA